MRKNLQEARQKAGMTQKQVADTDHEALIKEVVKETLNQLQIQHLHTGEKRTYITPEEAQKLARDGEEAIGTGSINTEDFVKSVVCLMSLMEHIWKVGQDRKNFRMELYFDAEAVKTNYCFFAPTELNKQTASCKKVVCDNKKMNIEEFNRLLLEYSKFPPRSKL